MLNIGTHKELAPVIPTAPTYIKSALDRSDCLKIIEESQKNTIHTYELENYGRFHGTIIPYTDDTAWIYGRLYDLALEINNEAYKFEPLDMVEHIWYYEFGTEDNMSWHTDMGPGKPFSGRKLTMILNLSTSDEYRGGQLLLNNGVIMSAPRSQGNITAFPSYLVNSTEPVKSGKRKILVAWFGGENFR